MSNVFKIADHGAQPNRLFGTQQVFREGTHPPRVLLVIAHGGQQHRQGALAGRFPALLSFGDCSNHGRGRSEVPGVVEDHQDLAGKLA